MATTAPQPVTAARDRFDPAGQDQAEEAFLAAPSFRETAVLDALRATEYGRLDESGDVYLDYTGGSLYAASQLEEHLRLLREHRLRQPALGQPHLIGRDRARGAGPRRRTALLQRARERVRLHLHPQRHGRAAARRRGLSVRSAGPVPGDVRQPQLGQRHPRVRAREGRPDGVRAPRGARPARRRRTARAIPRRGRARTATTCSPTPRSPTSPASSIRSSGSRWHRSAAGT